MTVHAFELEDDDAGADGIGSTGAGAASGEADNADKKRRLLILTSAGFVARFVPPDYLVDGLHKKAFSIR
jgi:hypothetical protein